MGLNPNETTVPCDLAVVLYVYIPWEKVILRIGCFDTDLIITLVRTSDELFFITVIY